MGKCLSTHSQPKQQNSHLNTSVKSPLATEATEEFQTLKTIPNYPMNPVATTLIKNALNKSSLFSGLSEEDLENIRKSAKFCVAEQNQNVFVQGSRGSLFFIINSGRVQVVVNGEKKGILQQNDCFGEMALLTDSVRKATIRTISKSSFWVISSATFFKALKNQYKRSYDDIRKVISNTLFFKNFSEGEIDLLSKVVVKLTFADNQVIIREGDGGDLIYILMSGCVMFKKGSEEFFRTNTEGSIFGEGSLLTGSTRKASCISIGVTQAISVNLSELKTIFGHDYEVLLLRNIAKNSILSDQYLGFLDSLKVNDLCMNLTWKKYKEDEIVFHKGKKATEQVFVICVGGVRMTGAAESFIGAYQVIGLGNANEKSLVCGEYVAVSDSVIGEIPVVQVEAIAKIDTKILFEELEKIKFANQVSFFDHLTQKSLNAIVKKMKLYTVLANTKIFEIGQKASKVYLIKSGVLEIYDSNNLLLRIVKKNEVLGERCLYEAKRSATAVCLEEAEIYIIDKKDLLELNEKDDIIHQAKLKEYYQRKVDLNKVKVVAQYPLMGRKKFCIEDSTKNKYGLIIIAKNSLKTESDCYKLVKEKEIMQQIEHRQLIKLVCTSSDQNNVYFITEHIQGAPLRALMPIAEFVIRKLVLHLIKILEYLHSKDIIYRDFCMDNIIISSAGIPYLHNYSSAKVVPSRTYTRIGTPFYRSPEMILGRGYTKATDIWSLGVIVFELAYGHLPFQMNEKDSPVDTYQKILNVVHGVDGSVDEETNKFILGLLCESNTRMNIQKMLQNQWFSNVESWMLGKKGLSMCENIFGNEIAEPKGQKFSSSIAAVMRKTVELSISNEVGSFDWAKYF